MPDGGGPAAAGRVSVPSAAPELVERLTAALGVAFTLTDEIGAVRASTAGHPRGHIDPVALVALRTGEPVEHLGAEALADVDVREDLDTPATVRAGLLAPEPGVYLPVRIDGRIDGILITHGTPPQVGTIGRTAAAIIGLALEFARGASLSARQSPGPDLALHQLLRGTAKEARRGALVLKVIGWDLSVPRVAVVVQARRGEKQPIALDGSLYATVADFVQTVAAGTPIGQLHGSEWVLLPDLHATAGRPSPQQLAEDVCGILANVGADVLIGVGEPHAERSVPALRRSYGEARYAARCGGQLRKRRGIFHLRDLGAAAFLAPSPATRHRLAERIVQPLRAQPDVLHSVRAFLDASCSFTATANETGLHRHTIRSHLDRARELTGLDPRVLDDALQLRIALMLARHTSNGSD